MKTSLGLVMFAVILGGVVLGFVLYTRKEKFDLLGSQYPYKIDLAVCNQRCEQMYDGFACSKCCDSQVIDKMNQGIPPRSEIHPECDKACKDARYPLRCKAKCESVIHMKRRCEADECKRSGKPLDECVAECVITRLPHAMGSGSWTWKGSL